jgi:hypothetical protein
VKVICCTVTQLATSEQEARRSPNVSQSIARAPSEQEVIDVNDTQVLGERIMVILIPQVAEHLRLLEERTSLSKTDLANRAITLYEFVDAQLRDGQEMAACDKETGTIRLVQLLGPSAGQAEPAGLACSRRGTAGPRWRSAGRPRRTPSRWFGWFPSLTDQSGQEVRTA